MLQKERKIEGKRDIKRKAEREEEEIYIHVSAARGRTTHIGISIYQSERQIDSSIHQSINQSPNHPSKIMNFLIFIATALFTTLVSCDVRIPILLLPPPLPPHHTPIISISHNNLLITYSLTPKPINSQQQECMAVTGGVGHGSGTCYRGTAESGIGQTCREVSDTESPFFFSVIHFLERSTDVFVSFLWKIGCAMLQ